MSRLLEEVSRDHFPYPPATPEEIEEFEQPVGWRLTTGKRWTGCSYTGGRGHGVWADLRSAAGGIRGVGVLAMLSSFFPEAGSCVLMT